MASLLPSGISLVSIVHYQSALINPILSNKDKGQPIWEFWPNKELKYLNLTAGTVSYPTFSSHITPLSEEANGEYLCSVTVLVPGESAESFVSSNVVFNQSVAPSAQPLHWMLTLLCFALIVGIL